MAMPNAIEALLYGFFTASSLMLGAGLGMVVQPSEHVTACLMAFGGGCLVYAVATQLYGEAASRLEESIKVTSSPHCGDDCVFYFGNNALQNVMGVLGALMYLGLNAWLTNMAQRGHGGEGDEESERGSSSARSPIQVQLSERSRKRTSEEAKNPFASYEVEERPSGRPPAGSHASGRASHASSMNSGRETRRISFNIHARRGGVVSMDEEGEAGGSSHGGKGDVALSMWLGLLLDGIPESLMLGFMTNSKRITATFLLAIFVANFPEAFSAAAILRAQATSKRRIFGMWGVVFILTGVLSMVGSIIMPSNVDQGSSLYRLQERAGAVLEGLTGGSMMAMIATAMLPEAFHGAGGLSGLLFVAGFVMSDFISALGIRLG